MFALCAEGKGRLVSTKTPDYVSVEITKENALWAWFADHHDQKNGAILSTWKAAHPEKFVSRDAVLDVSIAHCWIDGRWYVVDGECTAQLITRRKVQHWAQSYKDRAQVLTGKGACPPLALLAWRRAKPTG